MASPICTSFRCSWSIRAVRTRACSSSLRVRECGHEAVARANQQCKGEGERICERVGAGTGTNEAVHWHGHQSQCFTRRKSTISVLADVSTWSPTQEVNRPCRDGYREASTQRDDKGTATRGLKEGSNSAWQCETIVVGRCNEGANPHVR